MRPANDAQALAYRLLHEGEDRLPPEKQESFIHQRGGIPGPSEETEEMFDATTSPPVAEAEDEPEVRPRKRTLPPVLDDYPAEAFKRTPKETT